MARAIELLVINIAVIIKGFQYYLSQIGLIVSRVEFEQNLLLKKGLMSFRQNIESLLLNTLLHNFNNHFIIIMEQIINLLPGLPWQGKKLKLKVN